MTLQSIAVPVFALFLAACSKQDACGSGQVYQDGSCAPEVPEETSADAGGGTGGTGGTGGNGNAGASSDAFGAVCTEHGGCTAPTDYCAVQPGSPGYCTAKGCDSNPALCPSDWICFNVAQFAPGEPWICAGPR